MSSIAYSIAALLSVSPEIGLVIALSGAVIGIVGAAVALIAVFEAR